MEIYNGSASKTELYSSGPAEKPNVYWGAERNNSAGHETLTCKVCGKSKTVPFYPKVQVHNTLEEETECLTKLQSQKITR